MKFFTCPRCTASVGRFVGIAEKFSMIAPFFATRRGRFTCTQCRFKADAGFDLLVFYMSVLGLAEIVLFGIKDPLYAFIAITIWGVASVVFSGLGVFLAQAIMTGFAIVFLFHHYVEIDPFGVPFYLTLAGYVVGLAVFALLEKRRLKKVFALGLIQSHRHRHGRC